MEEATSEEDTKGAVASVGAALEVAGRGQATVEARVVRKVEVEVTPVLHPEHPAQEAVVVTVGRTPDEKAAGFDRSSARESNTASQ